MPKTTSWSARVPSAGSDGLTPWSVVGASAITLSPFVRAAQQRDSRSPGRAEPRTEKVSCVKRSGVVWCFRRRRQGHRGAEGRERRRGNGDDAARRAVEIERHEQQQQHEGCSGEHRDDSAPEDRDVEREQADGGRGAEYLERENGARYPVGERREARRLGVDRRVQAVDVEPRRA